MTPHVTARILVLSPRERQTLLLLAEGLSLREAATSLGIAPGTANTLARRGMHKLGVSGRVEALAILRGAHDGER